MSISALYARMYTYVYTHLSGGLLVWDDMYSYTSIDTHMCIQIHIHTSILCMNVYLYTHASIRGFAEVGEYIFACIR